MSKAAGFTLLEMIVVVAIVAILASVGGTPVMAWNCKRGLQRDFAGVMAVYGDVREQAFSRNRSMMLIADALGGGGYRFSWGESNATCSATPSSTAGSTDFAQVQFSAVDPQACFHPDHTAMGSGFTMSKTCGGTVLQYRATIFGATSYFMQERKVGDADWEEL